MTPPARWLVLRTASIDRAVALLLAPVIGPLVAALAWRVVRADGRPAFIALERMGQDGRTFRMWKLRTMRATAPGGRAGGATITSGADDRITETGRWLRRWRLDELPQLLNVVRGDMGLLGPRPETPDMVDLADPGWREVLAAKPGIAGATQLLVERWEADVLAEAPEEHYREVVLPVKVAVDAWYVRRATPALDLQVGWSLIERFALGRPVTRVERTIREAVAASSAVPTVPAS